MRGMLGICAFALFFLSDYNDWKWGCRAGRLCFPAGMLLLTAATVWGALSHDAPLHGVWRWAVLGLAAIFFILLIAALFFALPAGDAYTRPGESRAVVSAGMYALCRHPGVLWFAGLYLCLWGAAGVPFWETAGYSGLNVLLVIFEDRCVFPDRLKGYRDYQRTAPFLLPTAQSVRACWKTRRGGKRHAL